MEKNRMDPSFTYYEKLKLIEATTPQKITEAIKFQRKSSSKPFRNRI